MPSCCLWYTYYSDTVKNLIQESGVTLHTKESELFHQVLLNGRWDKAILLLPSYGFTMSTPEYLEAKALILEQWYLEKLESSSNDYVDAINLLRQQLSPTILELSSYYQTSTSTPITATIIDDTNTEKVRINIYTQYLLFYSLL
mgnify:CR=1 FL=1